MADTPGPGAEAITAAATVLLRQYDSEYNADHLTWRDFADQATEVLTAAWPLLRAEAVASERSRIIGNDRESLELMLASADSLDVPGPAVRDCAAVVRRLLADGDH